MANPLLRPNDPRFRQPRIEDAAGKNRFTDGAEPEGQKQGTTDRGQEPNSPVAGGIYAAGGANEARPYLPEYAAQQHSRAGLLLVLASGGWIAAIFGAISFTGVLTSGWISPLLGILPAGCAWLMAYEELKAVEVGAIDAGHKVRIQWALWLGLAALIACLSIVGSMIYLNMKFLPDVF